MISENSFLRYGDLIILQTQEHYVYSPSFHHQYLYSIASPLIIKEDAHNIVFQVLPKLDHKVSLKVYELKMYLRDIESDYSHRKDKVHGLDEILADVNSMIEAETFNKAFESDVNQKILDRKYGEPVKYGDTVEFRHHASGYFLRGTKKRSKHDDTILKVHLTTSLSSDLYFQLLPVSTHLKEGEKIALNQHVSIKHLKTDFFLSVGRNVLWDHQHRQTEAQAAASSVRRSSVINSTSRIDSGINLDKDQRTTSNQRTTNNQ